MTALWILCGVALFTVLVLLVPLGVELRYNGEIAVDAKIAFVRLRIIPKRKKKIRLRRFTKKRFERTLAKEKKKEEKKAAKKAAKSKKPSDKPSEAKPEKSAEKKEESPKLVSDLWQMRSLILRTVGRFVHRIRTKTFSVRVLIGSEDAATSALLYGAAAQFAAYVSEILRTQTKMRCREAVDIGVDFTSEKTAADIDVAFSISVGGVIATAIGFGVGFIKRKIKQDKR